MTTVATPHRPAAPAALEVRRGARQGPTELRTLRSEAIKMFSLRSTTLTLLAAVLALLGIGLVFSAITNATFSTASAERLAEFEPIGTSLGGVELAQLAVGVLGVLLVTGEYATGMIKSTLTAVPRRQPVLRAKALLYGVVILVISVPSAFAAFLGGQALLGTHGTTLSSPHAVRAIFGVALYLAVIGILAVAVGFIVRSTGGGIALLFGVLLVLPGLGNLLPTSWQQNVMPYVPSNAGAALYSVHSSPGTLAPWTGFAVLCLWTLLALVAAAVVLKRRDV